MIPRGDRWAPDDPPPMPLVSAMLLVLGMWVGGGLVLFVQWCVR
jgi:hypothetical protein